jgi:hypothetical protein
VNDRGGCGEIGAGGQRRKNRAVRDIVAVLAGHAGIVVDRRDGAFVPAGVVPRRSGRRADRAAAPRFEWAAPGLTLGLRLATLRSKMRKLGIERASFM